MDFLWFREKNHILAVMKKMIFMVTMLIMMGTAAAQEMIKSKEIGDFQAVTLSGNIAVEFIPANANSIDVSLFESAADKFRWSVSADGVLSIALRPTVGKNSRAEIRIYYKAALQRITASEARLIATKPIEAHCLRVDLTGGASANLAIDAKDLELNTKGNSAAAITGKTKYLIINASERGRVDTKGLMSTSVEVTATMASEVFVNATERLVALTRSGATIYHTGTPEILKNLSLRAGLGGGIFSIGEPINR